MAKRSRVEQKTCVGMRATMKLKANLLPLIRANTPDTTHSERQFTKIVKKITKALTYETKCVIVYARR